MTKKLLPLFFIFFITQVFSQTGDRIPLRGQVVYMDQNVPNENVINATSEKATITNEKGEFIIDVKVGDQLAFTAVNYSFRVVTITEEILANKRLLVEVTEKVTELDEVVITPEQKERFLKLKNEEFKEFEYEIDRSTGVQNSTLSNAEQGMANGLNFVNIFRAIFKSKKESGEEAPKLMVSQVLRQVYDDQFFVEDLGIPQDKINAFLFYCDEKMEARSLLKKENEFHLIDALVDHSKSFLSNLNEE